MTQVPYEIWYLIFQYSKIPPLQIIYLCKEYKNHFKKWFINNLDWKLLSDEYHFIFNSLLMIEFKHNIIWKRFLSPHTHDRYSVLYKNNISWHSKLKISHIFTYSQLQTCKQILSNLGKHKKFHKKPRREKLLSYDDLKSNKQALIYLHQYISKSN